MNNLHIVTVTWNRLQDTCECLDTLFQQIGIATDIVVVDNGSTDGTTEYLSKKYPTLKVIRSERNLGFASGYNLGIRFALGNGAENILIINNDTLADPLMCKNLLEVMISSRVAVTSPIIYYKEDPQKIWSIGGNIQPLILEPIDSHGRNEKVPDSPIVRTFISGCCMLINRRVFDKVGLFDERFFVYYEDLDFCLRLFEERFPMLVVPSAKLWHKVALSSGGQLSPVERYSMAFSSVLYFRKHVTWKNVILILFYRGGSALISTFRLIKKGNLKALYSYWHGIWNGIWAKSNKKVKLIANNSPTSQ